MRRKRLEISIVTRLVSCIVLGGVAVSLGLGVLQLHHSEDVLRTQITQRVVHSVRLLQARLRAQDDAITESRLRNLLQSHLVDPRLRTARVTLDRSVTASLSDWPDLGRQHVRVWHLTQNAMTRTQETGLGEMTLVIAPFNWGQGNGMLEIVIDGPAIREANRVRVIRELAPNWLFMSVMVLLGLMMLRHWFTGPLTMLMERIAAHSGPDAFYRVAKRTRGEFGQLAEAVGGMLTRLETTTDQLRKRERAFESLYQHAPAALINIDPAGKIVEANHRAAELLDLLAESILIGSPVMPFIKAEDRGLLRQAIDRLVTDHSARCEMRLEGDSRTIHAAVECVGERDEDGQLQTVRLSLLDISDAAKLQNELADKSRLMNLIIDHMSDGILLVNATGRIAAVNQQLGALLHRRPDALIGGIYDSARFWDELGVADQEMFVNRLQQIDADVQRPAQERFEARVGTFLFQSVPVQDTLGDSVGRLWVVSEITSEEHAQRLLDQQTTQLHALKRLGQQLSNLHSLNDLMERSSALLFDLLGVEAIGLAVRCDEQGRRSRQLLNRGTDSYLLEPNEAMLSAVERHLMPQLLSNRDVTLWPDLPRQAGWSKSFEQAGLTTLAGVPLTGGKDPHGIIWIARRGGERIERHHIYLLEAVAPMIAAQLDLLELHRTLHQMRLTDPTTDLPNRHHLEQEIVKLARQTRSTWSVLMISLDHFETLYETLDVASLEHLVRSIALSLKRAMRKSCIVTRLEGPTFGILCPSMDHDSAVAMADRLRQVVSEQHFSLPDDRMWKLTASIGVSASPQDGQAADAVLRRAGDRLELARRSGRDRVVGAENTSDRRVG